MYSTFQRDSATPIPAAAGGGTALAAGGGADEEIEERPSIAGLTPPASNMFAQQKQHVSLKSSVSDNKITQAQNVEVGDVPNHIVRVFEVRPPFANAPTDQRT
jgi:hypothetical protein